MGIFISILPHNRWHKKEKISVCGWMEIFGMCRSCRFRGERHAGFDPIP